MDKQFLLDCINDIEIDVVVNDTMLSQFEKYFELLIEWNEFMNLTAITEEKEVIVKHFADSVSLLKAYEINKNEKVIDIGTGAGFPSIPLKILLPEVEFTLVDSLNKRIKFLDEVISQLGLQKIITIHSRSEDLARDKKHREKYDVCVARAVANFSVLSEFCSPFVKKGGKLIALKGKAYKEEINVSDKAFYEMQLEVSNVASVVLPTTDVTHYIIMLEKFSQISAKYPRKAGVIKKNPL